MNANPLPEIPPAPRGEWTRTFKERPHTCRLPAVGSNQPGSCWRCSCGRLWEQVDVPPPAGAPPNPGLVHRRVNRSGPDDARWVLRSRWWLW